MGKAVKHAEMSETRDAASFEWPVEQVRTTATLSVLRRVAEERVEIQPVKIAANRRRKGRRISHRDSRFSLGGTAAAFSVTDRLGIPYACTLDRNFAQYGFALLAPEQGEGRPSLLQHNKRRVQ